MSMSTTDSILKLFEFLKRRNDNFYPIHVIESPITPFSLTRATTTTTTATFDPTSFEANMPAQSDIKIRVKSERAMYPEVVSDWSDPNTHPPTV